jgi:hypothetical protein
LPFMFGPRGDEVDGRKGPFVVENTPVQGHGLLEHTFDTVSMDFSYFRALQQVARTLRRVTRCALLPAIDAEARSIRSPSDMTD